MRWNEIGELKKIVAPLELIKPRERKELTEVSSSVNLVQKALCYVLRLVTHAQTRRST
ncbi:MAG: hypothetical protein V4485_04010 [Pseudomonadota bacterium]